MVLTDWDALVRKYFVEHEYEVFVPERGWGERMVKLAAASEFRAARWLGGTLAAVCKKNGNSTGFQPVNLETFESLLRCPDCHASLSRDHADSLLCAACGYLAPFEDQVYNLLPSAERRELYPGQRDDIIDFSVPGHERHLLGEWYELEGIHGNKYRWIGACAAARLARVKPGPQRLRIRGHASPPVIPGEVRAIVNGSPAGSWKLDRPGVFILEADLPDAPEYTIEIHASPTWTTPADDRTFTVNLSMIRLIDAEPAESLG
jgi:hypothetical protein